MNNSRAAIGELLLGAQVAVKDSADANFSHAIVLANHDIVVSFDDARVAAERATPVLAVRLY
jgi:hypothetical protein